MLTGRLSGGSIVMSRSRRRIRPAVGQLEPADHPQRRGLAAARRPEEREELAGPDVERDAVDGPDVAEVLLQVDQADLGGRRGSPSVAEARPPCGMALGGRPEPGRCQARRQAAGVAAPRSRLDRHQRVEVQPLGPSLARRPAQQVALAGRDPELADDGQLLAGLDALGDDGGAPPRGQLLERAQDAVGRVVQDPALDEGQVDLDDVEVDLGQESQSGVAGTDVVGRETHPGATARGRVATELLEVLDLLALGELDDQLLGADAAASEDRRELDRVELVRLQRAR